MKISHIFGFIGDFKWLRGKEEVGRWSKNAYFCPHGHWRKAAASIFLRITCTWDFLLIFWYVLINILTFYILILFFFNSNFFTNILIFLFIYRCPYLHRTAGDTERRYHLKYYKTGMCVHDTDNRGFCVKNGPHCAFAHGTNDLRPAVYDIR